MKTLLIWLSLCLTCFAAQDIGATEKTAPNKVLQEEVVSENETEKDGLPSIETFTENMECHDGFVPFFWDKTAGKVYLEIASPDLELLYVHSLATGLGSNPVGLDRGQLGGEKVVQFTRVGTQVLMLQKNLRFRARTDNELERRAVEQSFAQSVVWGGTVAAETDERFVIDVSSLILSDMHGVARTLKSADQGDFSLDAKRSAVYLPRCQAFPENTELEATLTYSSRNPGRYVRQTTPSPSSVTLRQHHSFVKLPDANYQPRRYDVRSPCISIMFADYATPLDKPLEQRWITRHRLAKKDPGASISEPIEPIVYYIDSGAPKQIQQALLEGASWWNEAFESAGFKNAFQVKILPPDADPMDVRYNVIQWVHRSTRGWSYGGSVVDPRTGEIIKGHVSLGSLRVRQDQLLVNSLGESTLVTPANIRCACCGIGGIAEEATLADIAAEGNALEVSLARIRQLSAHEVGHTIGFSHNFAASTYMDRASVMDYPAPRVKITGDGKLDLSDAYAVGIGEWDKVSVQYAYTQFENRDQENAGLNAILDKAAQANMSFLSDSDSRAAGASHPLANLWDNGTDPLVELAHLMQVRRIALNQFDPSKLPAETTKADVGQYLTPLYLYHRYQLQAVGKLLGGQTYSYGYATDSAHLNQAVPAETQTKAILELLKTLKPSELVIDANLLTAISPRPYSSIRDSEILTSQTGRIFDPLAAAKIAANLTINELLRNERLARMARQAALNPQQPRPSTLINLLILESWQPTNDPRELQVSRVVRDTVVKKLMGLVDNQNTDTEVHLAAFAGLNSIIGLAPNQDASDFQFMQMLNWRIKRFLERPHAVMPSPKSLDTPPGSPIGSN